MTNATSPPFDLIIFGHITRDRLRTSALSVERIGGVAYAASVAAKLGANVGLLASLDDKSPQSVIQELEARNIDCSGVQGKIGQPVVYQIHNADEMVRQSTFRSGPSGSDLALPYLVADKYRTAKHALIYPVFLPSSLRVARTFKESGCCVSVDIQHDLDSLEQGCELLALADFVFGNQSSFLQLTESHSIEDALFKVKEVTNATLVVKMGMRGSFIQRGETRINIPCYQSDFHLTVGAGDAYDAAFLINVAHGAPIEEAGRAAAFVTAKVIESTGVNSAEDLSRVVNLSERTEVLISPQNAQSICIYIAGHFHSQPLRQYIETVAAAVENLGFKTFVPHRDVGVVGPQGVNPVTAYTGDLAGLRQAQAVIAVLDNASRGGTFVEIGVAVELKIPIFAISTDETLGISNMVRNSCRGIHRSIKTVLNSLVECFSEL